MKISRHKKAQKYMSFYVNNFGFRQPFQILIDATFCFAAVKVILILNLFNITYN